VRNFDKKRVCFTAVGQCLAAVGVAAGDSRDDHGRERFHPFTPELHLIRGRVPHDNWFWQYNYFPARDVRFLLRPLNPLQ